jgi:cation transport ATPase
MNSFDFNDAVGFRLATQQEDTSAKVQVFVGVFLGVILRWIYSIAVDVIRNQAPWCFGTWWVILIRLAVALVATFFVFSGYWQKVKDQPASMRFWNALAYGITMDVIVGTWLPSTC